MNVLDRAIAFFDPQTGVQRAAARAALGEIRAYEGARGGRRAGDWRATNASANVEIKGALPRLRARSRDVVRNTWWGSRGKDIVVGHAVGTGIEVKSKTGNKRLDKLVNDRWREWCESCDIEGQSSFAGLLALATGCIFESGEVLGRMVPVTQRDARHVPFELQLLEPDHLDGSRDFVQTKGDAIVDQGIAYNKFGKRTGYYIYPQHPGARGIVMPRASILVPAADMLHPYRKLRIGQGRGVPWVAPVLLKGKDVADLEDAIVVKSRVEACLALWVKTTDQSRGLAGSVSTEVGKDGGSRRIEKLSPGAVLYGEPGEEANAINPSSSIQFESVLMMNWLALAAGIGVTYDQLTGDLRRANFSSLRAGKIEFRRLNEQFQWLTLADMLINPLRRRWIEYAQDFGVIPRRAGGYPHELIMPANEPIDPLKDMEADIMAVRSGRMTWPQFVGAWGLDPDTQLDEIEKWFKEIDARKIVLDTDPRLALVSNKGGAANEGKTEVNTNVKSGKKSGK